MMTIIYELGDSPLEIGLTKNNNKINLQHCNH